MTGDGWGGWVVLAAIAAVSLGSYLYGVWRRPDIACRWCGGTGSAFGCSWLGRLVSGNCWRCGGRPWRIRRVARWLKWYRNSRNQNW